jgi:hypothetical protein
MSTLKIYNCAICLLILVALSSGDKAFAWYKYKDLATSPGSHKVMAGSCRELVEAGVHNVGKIGLTVANMGHFGRGFLDNAGAILEGNVPSCAYPFPGRIEYLFSGSFWIGAIVGRDTLVSVGADGWAGTMEMWPAPAPEGVLKRKSISNPNDIDAVSEQDFIGIYVDTVTDPGCVTVDAFDNRPHMPLNIKVTQRSYAWSYSYAEDFVLFDYSIENIGYRTLRNVYMGIYVDGDVGPNRAWAEAQDDICGFLDTIPAIRGCPGENWLDTVNIAWIADNDGRKASFDNDPCPSLPSPAVTGTRVVRTPSESLRYSFNWWISNTSPALDFGPRRLGTPDDPFRDFGGFLGTPEGDRNKYYIMRHEEFDYDQLFCALDHTAEGWRRADQQAPVFAAGFDTRYLLSFGPFDIQPGEVLPISFCYVAGEDFHTWCEAYEELFVLKTWARMRSGLRGYMTIPGSTATVTAGPAPGDTASTITTPPGFAIRSTPIPATGNTFTPKLTRSTPPVTRFPTSGGHLPRRRRNCGWSTTLPATLWVPRFTRG